MKMLCIFLKENLCINFHHYNVVFVLIQSLKSHLYERIGENWVYSVQWHHVPYLHLNLPFEGKRRDVAYIPSLKITLSLRI